MAVIDLTENSIYVQGLDHDLIKQSSAFVTTQPTIYKENFPVNTVSTTSIIETISYVTASTSSSSITYRKRGYSSSLNQFVYWQTNVIDDGPPNGDQLIDVTVVGKIPNS